MAISPHPFFATAVSKSTDECQVASEIAEQISDCPPKLLLFFTGGNFGLDALTDALMKRFPDTVIAGCTTCGEIANQQCLEGSTVCFSLGGPIRVSAKLVPDLGSFRFVDGPQLLQDLAADLDLSLDQLQADKGRHMLLTLTDGLTAMEEILIASLLTTVPEMKLVGGGAADGFRFQVTRVSVGNQVARHAAVVILLEPNLPFHTFHLHHFRPTGKTFVVTEADPGRRFIRGLDGRSAPEYMAEILGIPFDDLLANPISAGVFGVQSYNEMFLRSIMNVFPDKLLMGGAIEEGTVLHLMKAGDLVQRTQEGLKKELAMLQDPAALLLFSCGGRLTDAQKTNCLEKLGETLCPIPTVGFSTYGEQFGSMQVNHTLTGLVLGNASE